MSLAQTRSKRNTRAPARFEDEPPASAKEVVVGPKKQKRRRINVAMRELGRWKPADDLALIISVQQVNDLLAVYKGVKFSSKFTLQEIEDRWSALLYSAAIQRVAMAAMRQLPVEIVARIYSNALFSKDEEDLLKEITITPTVFRDILDSNRHIFLPYRTEKQLKQHYMLMRYYNPSNGPKIPTFSEVEEIVDRDILNTLSEHIATNFDGQTIGAKLQEDPVHQELMLNARRVKREIRKLENEIPKWQALVDSVRGTSQSDFDNSNLAVLRGRHMRYLMILRQITFGRCTKDSVVDVDLSLEGPAKKISRRQGMIELQANGEFVIINTGRRPFYVDGQPVLGDGECRVVENNSVVEIDGLRFVFLINLDLIAKMKQVASEPQIKN